jgi:SAM-dependent methyltransferase
MTLQPPRGTAAAFHDFEQAGWQQAAEYYEATFGTLTIQARDPLLDAVACRAGTRLLDVACGPGYVAAAAAARGAVVVALDFSRLMLEAARQRHPDLTFQEGDAEALSFDPETFDAIVMSFGLLHLARPDEAIREAFRALVPGGRYAYSVWARPEEAVGFGMVLRAMAKYGTTSVGLPDGPPFFRFSDPDENRRTLAAAGFTDLTVRTLPIVWRLPSGEALFEAALHGGVRTSAALRAQTAPALAAIHQSVLTEAERYRDGDGIALPMPVVLASGRKPSPV